MDTRYQQKISNLFSRIPSEIIDITKPRVKSRPPTQAFSEFLTNREQGDWAESLVQTLINENIQRYQFGQDAPYANLVNLANIVNTSRLPTSATTYGDNMQQGGGQFANAATGAAIGNMIMPGAGAAIGGGIGLLI